MSQLIVRNIEKSSCWRSNAAPPSTGARRGIEAIRRRDVHSALALEQWLLRMTESFGDRVLPVDDRVGDRWGALSARDPLPAIDGLLAATALTRDLTLVTRNVRDVARTGVTCLNPFAT